MGNIDAANNVLNSNPDTGVALFKSAINGGELTSDEPIAKLTGSGYSIVGSQKYYKIEGDSLYLTEEGVAYCTNSKLPTVAVQDGSTTEFLITRRSFAYKSFQISETPATIDTNVAHVVINGNNVEIRDSAKFPNNEKLGVLGGSNSITLPKC